MKFQKPSRNTLFFCLFFLISLLGNFHSKLLKQNSEVQSTREIRQPKKIIEPKPLKPIKKIIEPKPVKQSWPELVGVDAQLAVKTIKKESTYTKVVIIDENSRLDRMRRSDRVRVLIDRETNKVIKAPQRG